MGNGSLCTNENLPDIPEPTYKPNARVVKAISIKSSAVFAFSVENHKLHIKPSNRVLKDILESTEHRFNPDHQYVINKIDFVGLDNETPFVIPSKFSINHLESRSNKKNPEEFFFKVDGYKKDMAYTANKIITEPFERKTIVETYGSIMEEILAYTPMATKDFYIVEISTAFYYMFFQHKGLFSELVNKKGSYMRIGLHFDETEKDLTFDMCKSIRITTEAYKIIMKYLKSNIFDHIRRVDMKSSYLSIREDEISFNENNEIKFLEKLKEIYKEDNNNNNLNHLNCTFFFGIELFLIYNTNNAPSVGSAIRFEEETRKIKFPNPFNLARRESGLSTFIDDLNQLSLTEQVKKPIVTVTSPKIVNRVEIKTQEEIPQPDIDPVFQDLTSQLQTISDITKTLNEKNGQ
jgi:hypothetical protein